MDKYDVKRDHRDLYGGPTDRYVDVHVPEFRYIAVDGEGDPNTAPAYAEAVESLYSVAYTVKFTSKNVLGRDFVVGPLEGLWWSEDPSVFLTGDKSSWSWRMMIVQPPWITAETVSEAVESAGRKASAGKKELPSLSLLRPIRVEEGRCLQIVHIGPYDAEAPTLERLHKQVMPERGLTFAGEHHEIYLSDPRRTAPEKLKTILRQPVREM